MLKQRVAELEAESACKALEMPKILDLEVDAGVAEASAQKSGTTSSLHAKSHNSNMQLQCEQVQTGARSLSNGNADGSPRFHTPWSVDEDDMDIVNERGTKRKAFCRSSPKNHSPDSQTHGRSQKMHRDLHTETQIQSDSKPSPQGDRTLATIMHGFPNAPDQAAKNCHRTSKQTSFSGGKSYAEVAAWKQRTAPIDIS